MEEVFLPWWLIFLFGMWAIALAVWHHSSTHREIRMWAGFLTLVYLFLIFVALGFVPSFIRSGQSILAQFHFMELGRWVCVSISLCAGIGMLGHISIQSRRFCYIAMTVSNALFCSLVPALESSFCLFLVAGISMKTLLKEWHHADDRNWKDSLSELFQFCQETVVPEKKGESWLIGVLSGILCCTLMGTVAYSLRTEFVRNESSRMATVLPFREVVKQIHSTASHSANETSLLDFLITQRADIVVLISIIVFVALASKLRDPERQSNLPTEIDDGHRATERL